MRFASGCAPDAAADPCFGCSRLALVPRQLLGTGVESIEAAEDRGEFALLLKKIGEPLLDSVAAKTWEEADEFAKTHPFPLILRPAYTLGGTGGGIARNHEEFADLLKLGFTLSPIHQILIEESVLGWMLRGLVLD